MGYSPWSREESDRTERFHFHFSLPCIGEGNGNSLQCSCLENPRDGGAWWAAIYGVAQSQTRLKQLSSSSSNYLTGFSGGAKEPTCQCRRQKGSGFDPCVRKIPWRRVQQPTPVFLPGESHGNWQATVFRVSQSDMTDCDSAYMLEIIFKEEKRKSIL